jgi:hypothetical protein
MDVVGGRKIRDKFAPCIRFDMQKRRDLVVEGKPPDAPGHMMLTETNNNRDVVHRRAPRIVLLGHMLNLTPPDMSMSATVQAGNGNEIRSG